MQDLTQTIFTGDNLAIMRGMDSSSVDLIYLDPPFNSKRNYSAPIGSKAAGAAFKDTWTLSDNDMEWLGDIAKKNQAIYEFISSSRYSYDESMMSYLIMMSVRLLEMKRILANHGSIYLHVDPTASHYLKVIMDCIFGKDMFQNEIIWSYRRWPSKQRRFQKMHDTILFYSKNNDNSHTWNQNYEPLAESTIKTFGTKQQVADFSSGHRKPSVTNKESKGVPLRDVWNIKVIAPISKERLGYPTQKPLALLKRIILASSDIDDVILDPFCGCATTLVAAQLEVRRWIGIDISAKAVELCKERLLTHDKELDFNPEFKSTSHIPVRTDKKQQEKEIQEERLLLNESPNQPHYTTHKPKLYGTQQGNCKGCERHYEYKDLEVDHIIPQSIQRDDSITNLQLLCSSCNRIKHDHVGNDYLIKRLVDLGIRRR